MSSTRMRTTFVRGAAAGAGGAAQVRATVARTYLMTTIPPSVSRTVAMPPPRETTVILARQPQPLGVELKVQPPGQRREFPAQARELPDRHGHGHALGVGVHAQQPHLGRRRPGPGELPGERPLVAAAVAQRRQVLAERLVGHRRLAVPLGTEVE